MVAQIKETGSITDDLSLLRIEFRASVPAAKSSVTPQKPPPIDIDLYDDSELEAALASSSETDFGDDSESASNAGNAFGPIEVFEKDGDENGRETIEERSADFQRLFQEGRSLAREGRDEEALVVLNQAYTLRNDEPALNKILAVLTFKERDYERAITILDKYLRHDPGIVDFWLYLSSSHKRTGDLEKALDAGNRVLDIRPDRVINLINLADIHQKLGDAEKAREFLNRALELDPQNRQARTLQSSLS